MLHNTTIRSFRCRKSDFPSPRVRLLFLTEVVNQEVGGEALGAVAHGGVVVRVSSEHQHGPAHDHGRVEVTEEAAVSENGPAQTAVKMNVAGRHRPPPRLLVPLVAGAGTDTFH